MKIAAFFILSILISVIPAVKIFAFQIPALTGPVIDQVGLLHPRDRNEIEAQIREMSESGKIQPQIVILKSLGEDTIESVGIQLADAWKLGVKGKDQGLILIVAPNEHKTRIEVGKGLEGDIPDATAHQLITHILTPSFRQGLYAQGIEDTLVKINSILSNGEPAPPPDPERERSGHFPWYLIFLLIFIGGNFLGPLFGYRRRGSTWFPGIGGWGGGFGGGSGGGWGGGGGGFNGGGSSGSW